MKRHILAFALLLSMVPAICAAAKQHGASRNQKIEPRIPPITRTDAINFVRPFA